MANEVNNVGDFSENAYGSRTYPQGLWEESSTKKLMLGTIRQLSDGRKFVYCSATAAALTAGCAVSKAVAPQACTVAAADALINLVGSRKVTLTLTGTPTANLYEDGYMILTAGTGIGECYKIKGNTADDVPASGRCTFYLYDKLKTTHVTATTTVAVYQNPYKNVLINPAVANKDATTAEKVLGVTQRPVTASYYFWAQTWGLGSAVLDASTSGDEQEERQLIAGTTAGRLATIAAGGATGKHYGECIVGADQTDAEAALVFLTIS